MGIETALLAATAAATIGSGVMGAYATRRQADSTADTEVMNANVQSRALEAQAKQEEQRASEERAMAQRRAEEKQIETDRLMAKQRAIAAASGGGTGGSAALIEAETGGEGKFQSDLEIWKGEDKGKGLDYQAELDRATARNKSALALYHADSVKRAGRIAAASQILGATGSALSMGIRGSGGSGSSSSLYYDPNRPSSPRGVN